MNMKRPFILFLGLIFCFTLSGCWHSLSWTYESWSYRIEFSKNWSFTWVEESTSLNWVYQYNDGIYIMNVDYWWLVVGYTAKKQDDGSLQVNWWFLSNKTFVKWWKQESNNQVMIDNNKENNESMDDEVENTIEEQNIDNWEFNEYYTNWQLKAEWNLKDWEKHWERIYYYENWEIEWKWNYENWEMEWKWVTYFDDWKIKEEWFYKNWNKDGRRVTYFESDWRSGYFIESIWNYKNWIEDWERYRDDGYSTFYQIYENGESIYFKSCFCYNDVEMWENQVKWENVIRPKNCPNWSYIMEGEYVVNGIYASWYDVLAKKIDCLKSMFPDGEPKIEWYIEL